MRRLVIIAAAALAASIATPALADGLSDDPLPRFEDRLCPGVVGLPVEQASAMVARIRENAARLDIRTGEDGACEANLIVTVLADGRDYLRRLRRERGYLFESLDPVERRALLSREGPARSWLMTVTRTRDGMPVGERNNMAQLPVASMWSAHSLIYVATRQDIVSAMVIIDRDAADGLSALQLADYATLHGLSRFLPEPATATPSIQRLFAGEEMPDGLTAFDWDWLERLYSSIPNLPADARLEGMEGLATD